ncbi:nucleic acid/nucleotide deaminase domain-containing protein [Streptomyces sp. NPDC094048]|uniref:nucleic acid/nucleotide deaminase domain-containing protein n=1 Tax=Streptomyces sp. NPDC094048 TaxID=3155207 RepID=UPI00331C8469
MTGDGRRRQGNLRRRLAAVMLAVAVGCAPVLVGPPGHAIAQPETGRQSKPRMPDGWVEIPTYDNPITQIGYDARKARHRGSPSDWGRNMAVGFADVTSLLAGEGRAKLQEKYGPYEIREAADDPDLFAALGLDPSIKALLVIPKLNAPKGDHSEEEIFQALDERGISPDLLVALWSERSPCATVCAPRIRSRAKNVKIFFSVKDKSWRGGSVKTVERFIVRALTDKADSTARSAKSPSKERDAALQRQQEAATAFTHGEAATDCSLGSQGLGRSEITLTAYSRPCPPEEPASALARMLGRPDSSPGGIDFSTLELRYMADTGSAKTGLRYSLSAVPVAPVAAGNDDNSRSDGVNAVREASDAFFVWLTLPTSTFWVNLNPSEPRRIVDDSLGRTDAGRVLLQADLRMKKTIAQLIHPDSTLGARYWKQLRGTCMSMRTWIVPAPAEVHESSDQLYILDAPLSVKMETQYLNAQTPLGTHRTGSCRRQEKSVEAHNESVFRSMILPRVERAVNTAPEYASLRRVYRSRVAAEWYRRISEQKTTAYGGLINRGDIGDWATRTPWRPVDTFNDYVDSYTKGEFKVTHRTRKGNTIYTDTYVFGGVDLTKVPFHEVADNEFRAKWPRMADRVDQSWGMPVSDTGSVWLGGGISPSKARQAAEGGSGLDRSSIGPELRWAIPVVVLAVLLLLGRRLRRSGRLRA